MTIFTIPGMYTYQQSSFIMTPSQKGLQLNNQANTCYTNTCAFSKSTCTSLNSEVGAFMQGRMEKIPWIGYFLRVLQFFADYELQLMQLGWFYQAAHHNSIFG